MKHKKQDLVKLMKQDPAALQALKRKLEGEIGELLAITRRRLSEEQKRVEGQIEQLLVVEERWAEYKKLRRAFPPKRATPANKKGVARR